MLGGIFNFTPEPTWAQVIGWLAYVVVTVALYLRLLHRAHVRRSSRERERAYRDRRTGSRYAAARYSTDAD